MGISVQGTRRDSSSWESEGDSRYRGCPKSLIGFPHTLRTTCVSLGFVSILLNYVIEKFQEAKPGHAIINPH